jgi:tRNA(Arg) A34 adenosine deaminase TadA
MLINEFQLALPGWIAQEVDAEARYADASARMALALRLAARNVEAQTGGPFGAAVFREDGRLIAVGVNRVLSQNCSVAHAEMMAFACAQARVRRHRLNEDGESYILATSAQPCAMCYGATFWAGIDELLIGARAEDVTSLTEFDEGPLPADWIGELERRGISVKRDILRDAARNVLSMYSTQGGQRY